MLRTMVIESNSPFNPLFGLLTPSNKWVKMPGASKSPIPKLKAAARTNRSLRVNLLYERTRTPDTATEAKRNVVTPPRTGFGTELRSEENMENRRVATYLRGRRRISCLEHQTG